jgi:hypothetical protein
MKRTAIVLLLGCSAVAFAADDDLQSRTEASRAAVKEFAGALQGELGAAMKEGGPIAAIAVCNAKAPEIATEQAAKRGWTVGRTTLKSRNEANAPDTWERAVLESFEARRAAGEALDTMEHAEIVTAEGGAVFRYMKAIPTGEVCLACHGSAIKPEITAKLDALYPSDQARGFSVGDIRGAFTIQQPVR